MIVDVATERIEAVIGQVRLEQLVELVHVDARIHHQDIVLLLPVVEVLFSVVLVLQFADDFFDKILRRHQAPRAAVLVNDNGQPRARRAKISQELIDFLRFGHIVWLSEHSNGRALRRIHEVSQRCVDADIVILEFEHQKQILRVGDATNRIEGFLVDRHPRMTRLANRANQIAHCRILFDGGDIHPWNHDLSNDTLVESEDAFDHVTLALFKNA